MNEIAAGHLGGSRGAVQNDPDMLPTGCVRDAALLGLLGLRILPAMFVVCVGASGSPPMSARSN